MPTLVADNYHAIVEAPAPATQGGFHCGNLGEGVILITADPLPRAKPDLAPSRRRRHRHWPWLGLALVSAGAVLGGLFGPINQVSPKKLRE